jgi:hypothetical protein
MLGRGFESLRLHLMIKTLLAAARRVFYFLQGLDVKTEANPHSTQMSIPEQVKTKNLTHKKKDNDFRHCPFQYCVELTY